jgi:hypothetical protein
VVIMVFSIALVSVRMWLSSSLPSRDAILSLGLLGGAVYLLPALWSARLAVDAIATVAAMTLMATGSIDAALVALFALFARGYSWVALAVANALAGKPRRAAPQQQGAQPSN